MGEMGFFLRVKIKLSPSSREKFAGERGSWQTRQGEKRQMFCHPQYSISL